MSFDPGLAAAQHAAAATRRPDWKRRQDEKEAIRETWGTTFSAWPESVDIDHTTGDPKVTIEVKLMDLERILGFDLDTEVRARKVTPT